MKNILLLVALMPAILFAVHTEKVTLFNGKAHSRTLSIRKPIWDFMRKMEQFIGGKPSDNAIFMLSRLDIKTWNKRLIIIGINVFCLFPQLM